jgi:hypothetical protein
MKRTNLVFLQPLTMIAQPGWSQAPTEQPAEAAAPAPKPPAAAHPRRQAANVRDEKVDGTDNVYVFRYGNSQAMFVVTLAAGVIATDPIGYGVLRRWIPILPRSRRSPTSRSSI